MSQSELVFRSELSGHTGDVRAIASYRSQDGVSMLLTGSRDQTARLWIETERNTFDSYVIDNTGNGFVNAVSFYEDLDGQCGQDALINAYSIAMNAKRQVKIASSPRFTLVGHADNISTIATYKNQYIVSGSWDATVKVWKNWQCVQTFTKHTLAVWSVLPIDADRFLSASADKTVYLWAIDRPEQPMDSYMGATQPVRGLAQLSSAQFASAGNDTEIRIYALDGPIATPSQTLRGHTSFVYSLATRSSDTLISSGEDHTLRVWQNASLAQVVTLPAISVWCTCVMPNGDVACGSSDGQVRVFTSDLDRTDAEQIAAFETQVQSQALADSEVDARTPRGERSLLKEPGSHEGATCVVRDGSRNEVFRWTSHKKQWKPIGIISESAGSSQKKIHDGKAYDYVFDVDVEDGAPPLKLPYNANENPYEAAQRFLQAYELPPSYLDQVVQFLQKNTQSMNLAAPTASDPYTGSSGYHAGSAESTAASNTAATQRNTTMDPFTGSGGITSGTQSSLQVIPYADYLAFPQANLQAARNKIQQLAGDDAPLSEVDASQLDSLIGALENSTHANVDVVSRLLSIWPIAKRFPLLDLLRIAACKPSSTPFSAFATSALIGADWDALESQSDRKAAQTNAMLALRTLSNGFQAPNGTHSLNEMALETLATLQQPPWPVLNKNARIALATIVLNFSVIAVRQAFSQAELLMALIIEVGSTQKAHLQILQSSENDSETVYRTLIALGNLLYSSNGSSFSAAQRQTAIHAAKPWLDRLQEARIQTIGSDLLSLTA